ncbi:unnamed protein product [Mytilus coruscus]|uniref:Uncharacterized protein n=1 Tax=Mytilus coruscus TaxID=42192 RepID=A0A6J8D3M9_MYTCO|nr:unnamed protein product [Mytilus coruscus]
MWKKVDITSLKDDAKLLASEFTNKFNVQSEINTLWNNFKDNCLTIIDKNVPSKSTPTRISQPWITKKLRSMSRRKQKLHNRADKKSGKKYKNIKKLHQRKCRETYNQYINNMICNDDSSLKLFWNYIKNKKNDRCGVTPLKRNGPCFSDKETSDIAHQKPKDNLGWETLRSRRAKDKTILLYKIVNHLVNIPTEPYLIPTGVSTRGHNTRYLQPHCRKLVYQHSFFPSAIRIWNYLPQPLVSLPTLGGFKQALATSTIS